MAELTFSVSPLSCNHNELKFVFLIYFLNILLVFFCDAVCTAVTQQCSADIRRRRGVDGAVQLMLRRDSSVVSAGAHN